MGLVSLHKKCPNCGYNIYRTIPEIRGCSSGEINLDDKQQIAITCTYEGIKNLKKRLRYQDFTCSQCKNVTWQSPGRIKQIQKNLKLLEKY